MEIIPSILIHNGQTARLIKGDFKKEKVYDLSPLDLAKQFESAGIEKLHLVDLDGAKKGYIVNYPTLEMLAGHTSLKINFTGGLHTDGDVNKAFEFGADSITASTISIYRPELFKAWMISHGREKIMLGADSLDRQIRVGGWLKKTKVDLFKHIAYYYERGLKYIKTTDISREALLEGPPMELYQELLAQFPNLHILAKGGVRDLADIEELKKIGIHSVIFSSSYYEGRITLQELSNFIASNH